MGITLLRKPPNIGIAKPAFMMTCSLRYTPDTVTSQHVRFEYRYDAYGNWVERTVLVRHEVNAEFEPSNIERRAITYH